MNLNKKSYINKILLSLCINNSYSMQIDSDDEDYELQRQELEAQMQKLANNAVSSTQIYKKENDNLSQKGSVAGSVNSVISYEDPNNPNGENNTLNKKEELYALYVVEQTHLYENNKPSTKLPNILKQILQVFFQKNRQNVLNKQTDGNQAAKTWADACLYCNINTGIAKSAPSDKQSIKYYRDFKNVIKEMMDSYLKEIYEKKEKAVENNETTTVNIVFIGYLMYQQDSLIPIQFKEDKITTMPTNILQYQLVFHKGQFANYMIKDKETLQPIESYILNSHDIMANLIQKNTNLRNILTDKNFFPVAYKQAWFDSLWIVLFNIHNTGTQEELENSLKELHCMMYVNKPNNKPNKYLQQLQSMTDGIKYKDETISRKRKDEYLIDFNIHSINVMEKKSIENVPHYTLNVTKLEAGARKQAILSKNQLNIIPMEYTK